MPKIIGNTTATPNPQPDWAQTDVLKADYIKNKPHLLTEEEIIQIIIDNSPDDQVQSDWEQTDASQVDYIKNKPNFSDIAFKDKIEREDLADDVQESLSKADTALQEESDPTVPDWAKQPNKPTYTAQEVGALPDTTTLADLPDDANHRTVTDEEKTTWNNKFDKVGGTVDGDVVITGDLTVHGATIFEEHETILAENNVLVINSNKVDLKTSLAGLAINKNDSSTYGAVYDPTDDTFKFGEGSLSDSDEFVFNENEGLPFAIRDDADQFTDGHVVAWSAEGNKLVDGGKPISNIVKYSLTKSDSTITLTGSDGSTSSVTDADTNTTYTLSKSGSEIILTGSDGSTTSVFDADSDTNTTYTLSKSGSTITLTGSDGSTTSVADSDTTYSAGNGLTLSDRTFNIGAGTGISVGADTVGLATSGVTAGSYGPTANVSGTNGTTINVPQITVDAYGRVTGVTNRTYTSVDTDTHYTTRIYAGASGTAANAAVTSPYVKITDDNTYRNQIRLIGGGTTAVSSDANGNITISSTAYTHPTYTARTGKPTANATPGFGGTFTVSQITSDGTGHVTGATDRTITIPNTAAGSALGLVKSGGDVTISSGVISVNDDSHNHVISNVDGLQSELDDKYSSKVSRTANTVLAAPNGSAGSATFRKLVLADLPSGIVASSCTGNAATATKATQDENGKNIASTYATKTALSNEPDVLYGTSAPASSLGKNGDIYIQYS
jgi:hypothetical protein